MKILMSLVPMVATGFWQEPLYYIELSSNSGMIESHSINVY